MDSSWRPNPNAKPFLPSSAFYNISIPCKKTPVRIQKKGVVSRIIQWTLVIVLCLTVVINILFILDTTSKLQNKNGGKDQVVDNGKTQLIAGTVPCQHCSCKKCANIYTVFVCV